MSTKAKANSDLANAGLAGPTKFTHVSLSRPALAALENAILTPPPWLLQDTAVLLLPEWLQSWSSLAHRLEYSEKEGSIWRQLVAASPETILSVMNILSDLINASSEKITVDCADPGTWARIVYRAECYRQLLAVLCSNTSTEGKGAFAAAISMHDVVTVYARTFNTVKKHLELRYPSMFEQPVVEGSSSNSSTSASAPAPVPVKSASRNVSALNTMLMKRAAPVVEGSSSNVSMSVKPASAKPTPAPVVEDSSSNVSASAKSASAKSTPAPVVEGPSSNSSAPVPNNAASRLILSKNNPKSSDSDSESEPSDSDSKSPIVVGRPPNPLHEGIAGGRKGLKRSTESPTQLPTKPLTIAEQLKNVGAESAAKRDPGMFENIGSNSSSSASKPLSELELKFAKQRTAAKGSS